MLWKVVMLAMLYGAVCDAITILPGTTLTDITQSETRSYCESQNNVFQYIKLLNVQSCQNTQIQLI